MSDWQPAAYKEYRWIVTDPDLLGGKLAIRGTRVSVSLILECLANGMSIDDINAAYDNVLTPDALSEVLKVASELTEAFHVAALTPTWTFIWLAFCVTEALSVRLQRIGVGRLCRMVKLVTAAVAAGFTCLLTRDRLFGESPHGPFDHRLPLPSS